MGRKALDPNSEKRTGSHFALRSKTVLLCTEDQGLKEGGGGGVAPQPHQVLHFSNAWFKTKPQVSGRQEINTTNKSLRDA